MFKSLLVPELVLGARDSRLIEHIYFLNSVAQKLWNHDGGSERERDREREDLALGLFFLELTCHTNVGPG